VEAASGGPKVSENHNTVPGSAGAFDLLTRPAASVLRRPMTKGELSMVAYVYDLSETELAQIEGGIFRGHRNPNGIAYFHSHGLDNLFG
jgi:bacteriocin-like protein